MVTAMITMIKMGGCSFLLGETVQRHSPSPPMRQDGALPVSAPPSQWVWKGPTFPVLCLVGSVGEMSGDHDPLEGPGAPAWLQEDS